MLARQKIHLTTLDLTSLISNSIRPQVLSVLYSNRGVLYYESGNYQWALNDLNKALQLNHLNYAAYFNLFSILYQSRPDEPSYRQESLKNLCCSLSCLYLMRGKKRNNEADVSKCVKLAENNCQGRLLRALQYYKKQKHTLALNQLKWVLDLQPSNLEILRVKNIIQSKLRDLGKGRYNYNQAQEQEDEFKQQQQNQPYKNGSKRLKCSLYQNTSEDEQFDINEQIKVKSVQFEVLFKDIFGKLATSNNMADGNHKLIISLNRHNQKSDKKFQEVPEQVKGENEDENLISNQLIQQDAVEEENGLNAYLVGSRNKNSSRSSFEGSTNSFLTIVARDDQSRRINVKVGKIRIVEQESQPFQSNNQYCSFQFGEPKLHLIMSTPESGMNTNKRKCENEEDDFKILKVKVFNKQILSFKDRFIGQGQDEIKGPGKYNIVLYNHCEQGVEDVGYVEIYVQFV